jgi:hypothetical protein
MKSLLNIQIVAVLALVLLWMGSCTEHYDEMNTNKSLVTEEVLNPDLLLTYVEVEAVIKDADGGAGTVGNYPGMSVSEANVPFRIQANTGIWNNNYGNYARNLSDLIRILKKRDEENGTSDNTNRIAIARILKAWYYARVTDCYGDVPYFESCLPQEEAVYTPKYDTQQSIYDDLFKELKEAAAQLDENKESFGAADLIYGGDVVKWEKLANSLRLRLALRVRYVDQGLAQSEMSDLTEANLITTSDDNAFIMTANDYIENTNPNYNATYSGLYSQGSSLTKRYVTKTMVDIWQDNFDPRLKLFADTAEASWPGTPGYEDIDFFGYRGRPLLDQFVVEHKYPWGAGSSSRWSLHYYAPVWPMPIMSAQEVYFALAEAALFGIKGSAADAQGLYEKGMRAALKWAVDWNATIEPQLLDMFALYRPEWTTDQVNEYAEFHRVTQEEVDAFADTAAVMTLTGTVEEQHEMIMNQKIAGLYPTQVYEGWFEWRRTGYPRVLIGGDGDDLHGTPPRRYMWPDAEQTLNADSYNEAKSRIGGTDGMLIKVWWDTNPNAPHEHPGEVPWMDQPWI